MYEMNSVNSAIRCLRHETYDDLIDALNGWKLYYHLVVLLSAAVITTCLLRMGHLVHDMMELRAKIVELESTLQYINEAEEEDEEEEKVTEMKVDETVEEKDLDNNDLDEEIEFHRPRKISRTVSPFEEELKNFPSNEPPPPLLFAPPPPPPLDAPSTPPRLSSPPPPHLTSPPRLSPILIPALPTLPQLDHL
jgi:hypothetical protein